MNRRPTRRHGLTLVELLLTIVLVGTLSSVAVTQMAGTTPKVVLMGELNRMRAKIYLQRNRAAANGLLQRVTFDPANSRYQLLADSGAGLSVAETVALKPGVVLLSTTFGANNLDFKPGGAPAAGGSVALQADTSVRS
ncbi:MAG: prepilin-type N-terminal cleavage/methylation domain-containing protein, partial [Candidatus Wallbacteria bacterium]|nr:prepilin-type N-terminal cleavage/methylation domain-containing protein [Candidatus Wallbacteria bacterium]